MALSAVARGLVALFRRQHSCVVAEAATGKVGDGETRRTITP